MSKSSTTKGSPEYNKQIHPSYGQTFGDPGYLTKLIQQAPTLSEKEFLSKIMEGIYFFRLPLVAFMGMANIIENTKDKEQVLEQHQVIFKESQLLLKHLVNLMRFVKAYQQKKFRSLNNFLVIICQTTAL